MKKIKYIFKKLFIIFLIAFISIFIYEIFTELQKSSTKEETYGTKLSADEEIEGNGQDISNVIERVSNAVVGISKIKKVQELLYLKKDIF